ncbi:MAG: aspartyl/glutamyl-tRNA amidotransferase subunit B [Deltaproteobacteria bacterium RBG_16_54_11]|nr:MAG: aspartyl/glutamyl-tRNA amidotransferase subunit B [Deltaproteobacteria bacterium RBG_16_54_11]
MEYETVIGLEVHAQLLTASKIFCGCSATFGAEPNTHSCPVCTGMPGSLPVLNRKAVEFAIKLALATDSHVASFSLFARKNYFYPDLPKGYQISQYELPLSTEGYLEIPVAEGGMKRVGITRIHMEEDAGKLFHDEAKPFSYVDFNRTGVPLLEIVSEPDLSTPEQAADYLRQLRTILQYLEICDGNMEEGSFRCDANVSIRPVGAEKLGTRTEVKNMNSFRHVERALTYEIERQKKVLEGGREVIQETRLWDPAKGVTEAMRGKEEAHDYRYFPDPDLVPLTISLQWVEEIRKGLPELPLQRKGRFVKEYRIPEYDAGVITASKALADYYEECVRLFPEPKQVSNWIMGDLLRLLKEDEKEAESSPLSPKQLAAMLGLIKDGTISGKIAKTIFEEMYKTGKGAKEIVEEQGLVQITDEAAVAQAVAEVLQDHPKEIEEYKNGKAKLFGFFVGQVMKATQGKANPQLVNEILKKKLS